MSAASEAIVEGFPDQHWSDCAVYNEPALPVGPCDCGGLKLADYAPERFRPTLIPSTGRFGFFVSHGRGEGFIEPHQLPTDTLIRIAAAANLPNAHGEIAGGCLANGVDFDDAREAIIAQFKALAASQRSAGHI